MSDLYELPDGWEWKKISDVLLDIKTGTTPPKKEQKYYDNPSIKWFAPSDFGEHKELVESKNKINSISITDKKAKVYPSNSLLLVAIGATVGKIGIIRNEASSNQQITAMKFKDDVDVDFSYYWFSRMKQTIIDTASTATLPIINQNGIKSLPFPYTPFSEQQRIVSKLDKLFEKIDKAIVLHQKNMDESNVFMGSVLNDVFVELEEKYGLKEINSLFKIKSGNFLPAKNMVENGEINVYGGNGINGKHNEFNLSGENILIGRVGALCGNVRCVNDNIWLTDNAFYISEYFENIDKNFLTQMLIHIDLGSSANKSAQPVISYKSISEMTLPLPPLQIQQKVVSYLDEISQKIEKIKQIQKEKMDSLKALKASILDQAFRGEL